MIGCAHLPSNRRQALRFRKGCQRALRFAIHRVQIGLPVGGLDFDLYLRTSRELPGMERLVMGFKPKWAPLPKETGRLTYRPYRRQELKRAFKTPVIRAGVRFRLAPNLLSKLEDEFAAPRFRQLRTCRSGSAEPVNPTEAASGGKRSSRSLIDSSSETPDRRSVPAEAPACP